MSRGWSRSGTVLDGIPALRERHDASVAYVIGVLDQVVVSAQTLGPTAVRDLRDALVRAAERLGELPPS